MKNGIWDLSQLYKTNDDFDRDLKIVEKYLENIKKFKERF